MDISPFDLTFQLLADAPNPAAVHVLAACLDEDDAQMQAAALRVLLARPERHCLAEIVRRWPETGRAWAELVEPPWQRFEAVVREGLLSGDPLLASAAGRAAVDLELFELIPVLVHATERHIAAKSRAGLAGSLLKLVRGLRDRRRGAEGLPPPTVLADQWEAAGRALAASVEHFSGRRHTSILLAWLLAADPRPARYNIDLRASLRTLLVSSHEPEVLNFLLGAIADPTAPDEWIDIATGRRDIAMLRRAIERVANRSWSLPKSVGRPRVRWFRSLPQLFGELDSARQISVVQLVHVVDPVRPSTEDVLALVVAQGTVAARLAALQRQSPSDLIGTLAQFGDIGDCAAAAFPVAANGALGEFTCDSFLASFDELDKETRIAVGHIVGRTDPNATRRLARELASDSPSRRRRALAAAVACGAVDSIIGLVLAAMTDPCPNIRVAAAEALSASQLPEARQALREALVDEVVYVQLAAEKSLDALHARAPRGRGG